MNWFVVHTLAQGEAHAAWHLERRGYQVLYPHFWEELRGYKTPRWQKRGLFSRYLFVRCDRSRLGAVNDCWGVASVVYFGGEPYPVPDRAMEVLIERTDPRGEILAGKIPANRRSTLAPGDEVLVAAEKNPLFGFYLVVKDVLDNGTVRAMFPKHLLGSQLVTIRESDVRATGSNASQKPLSSLTATGLSPRGSPW